MLDREVQFENEGNSDEKDEQIGTDVECPFHDFEVEIRPAFFCIIYSIVNFAAFRPMRSRLLPDLAGTDQ